MIQVIVEIKEIRIKRKRGEEYETHGKEKQKKRESNNWSNIHLKRKNRPKFKKDYKNSLTV